MLFKATVWLLTVYLYHGIVVLSLHNVSMTTTVAPFSAPLQSMRTQPSTQALPRVHQSSNKNANVTSLNSNLTTAAKSVAKTEYPEKMTNGTTEHNHILSNFSNFGNNSVPSIPPLICYRNLTKPVFNHNKSCYTSSDPLKCFHDPIFCELHFKSGHRDMIHTRPTYGEYSSLEHERWFTVIQHGGIAFLYHPCTNTSEINKMRRVASQCLHRHIIAPYPKLTQNMPLALVSWGCYYVSNAVRGAQMRAWIRKHAYKGPASHVHTNGKYRQNLVKKSQVLTNVKDAILCPSEEEKSRFSPDPSTTPFRNPIKHFDHESIIKQRVHKLSKLKPGLQIIQTNLTVTQVKAGNAAWAAASLIFLCGILVGWLIYTRQYPCGNSTGYKYNRVSETDFESFECEPGESDFNMLKSNQKIMSAFRWKNLNNRCDKRTLDAVHSMVPIDEECHVGDDEEEEEETVFFKR